jgi:hypothetical protein
VGDPQPRSTGQTRETETRPKGLVVRGRHIPLVLPKRSDPRLKLSATIFVLTVLGQTILRFQVSVAQILVCVVLSAATEVFITFLASHVIAWPASAIQTGISVAFIFRVSGTVHGEVWSLHGIRYFVLVIALSLAPKYLLRINRRHVFNPSNLGIVAALLLIGPKHVFSEHLWWAPLGGPLLIAMAVIVGGAWWVLRQVKMVAMAAAFLATFSILVLALAVTGHHYYATWYVGTIGGGFYWSTIALSPEVLIFAFFMMSDPQTAPTTAAGRVIYAMTTAILAAGLISVQTSEFGIKVALLSSLVLACALTPLIDRAGRGLEERRADCALPHQATTTCPRPPITATRKVVLAAVVILAVGLPMRTVILSRDRTVDRIELHEIPSASQ